MKVGFRKYLLSTVYSALVNFGQMDRKSESERVVMKSVVVNKLVQAL